MNQSSPEKEPDAEPDFFSAGGIILEEFDDKSPKRWRCGQDEQGKYIDPPGVDAKDVVRNTIGKIVFGRIAPGSDENNEIAMWRTDWKNPDDRNNAQG